MSDQAVEWLSIDEFCKRINHVFSRSLVSRKCRSGELEAVRLGDRWAIRADALDILLERQRESEHEAA